MYLKGIVTFCFLSFLAINLTQAQAQSAVIWGNSKDYRGVELSVTFESDFLSKQRYDISKFEPDVDGNFRAKVPIKKTMRLEMDLGKYKGILFLEPGQDYEIALPPRQDKTKADKYNPFFVQEEVYIGVKNKKGRDLTSMIANLEDSLATRIMPGMPKLIRMANKEVTEKLLAKIESFFADYANPYFQKYMQYRFDALRYAIYNHNDHKMLKEAYMNKPLLLNLPPYTKLFRELAKDGLVRNSDSEKWNAYNIINKDKHIGVLRDSMQHFPFAKDKQLLDLYIICGLYDAFYSGDFPKQKVINFFNKMEQTAAETELKDIAAALSIKTSHLLEGTEAPDISLFDEDGRVVRLSDFRGKFVYINFGASWSVPFKREMKLLKKLHESGLPDLQVLTVSFDQDFQRALYLKKKNDYKWPILHFGFDESIAETYRIRINPTYYLIGPDGTLLQSPAIPISENFAEFFVKIRQNWQRKQNLRNKGIKN